jgi:MoaA/NifB/PqqE/SkfB family radical SAM enzyme
LLSEARAARQTGAESIQLDGLDPAAFSLILPLVEGIRGVGFRRLVVMGTGRRFADAGFRRDFFSRAPGATVVVIPLYGVTAAVHDDVTGRPGSHQSALASLEGILTDRGRFAVEITTVATLRNMDELAQVIESGVSRRIPVRGRLPYVLRDVGASRYAGVAMRESEIVARFAATLPRVRWRYRRRVARAFRAMMPHPCVLRREGGRLRPHRRDQYKLEGAVERFVDLVQCPHVETCDLSSRCPGVVYAEYAAHFGTAELG